MIRFYQLFVPLLWSNRSSTFLWERTSIEVHLTLQYSLYIVYHIGKGFLNTNFTKVIDILWAAYAIYHNIFDSPILKLLFNFLCTIYLPGWFPIQLVLLLFSFFKNFIPGFIYRSYPNVFRCAFEMWFFWSRITFWLDTKRSVFYSIKRKDCYHRGAD